MATGSVGSVHQLEPGRPRRRPQQSRSRQRFETVIEATRRLVEDGGPDDITTTVVAERAGVSVAWIYQYFEDKQALFDTIVIDALPRLAEETQRAGLEAITQGWRESVRAMLLARFRFFARNRSVVDLWYSPFRSLAMERANTEAVGDDPAGAIYSFLVQQGALRPGRDTRKAVELMVGLANSGLELCFRSSRRGDRAMLEELATTLIGLLERHATDEAERR